MDLNDIANGIIDWVKDKGFSFWAKIILGVSAALLIYSIWISFGIIVVDVERKQGVAGEITLYDGKDSKSRLFAIGSVAVIRRADAAVVVKIGQYRSVAGVELPWYGFASLKVSTAKDTNADKYYSKSRGCLLYDTKNDRVISYKCERPDGFYYIDTANSTSPELIEQKIAAVPSSTSAQGFLDGIIGVTDSKIDPRIFYSDYTGNTKYLKNPDGISPNDLNFTSVITDKSVTGNSTFLLTTLRGEIYVGRYSDDSVTYQKIDQPKDYSNSWGTSCQLLISSAYCYQGKSASAPSGDSKDATQIQGNLSVINISDPQKISVTKYKTDTSITISNLLVLNTNTMAFISNNNLYTFSFSGDRVVQSLVAPSVQSGVIGDDVYFLKDSSVYKIANKNSATMVFNSDNLTINKLISNNGGIFFDATTKGSPSRANTYKLNDSIHDASLRLVDILPLSYKNVPDVSSMDDIKNNLYIRVKVSINKTARTSLDRAVNMNDFNLAKARILQQLKDMGINPESLTITFAY
jgi:hypothetical protein